MTLSKLKSKLANPDAVPTGWKTRVQWQKDWKLGTAQSGQLLRDAVTAGLCRTKKFRIQNGGVLRPTAHYKFNE